MGVRRGAAAAALLSALAIAIAGCATRSLTEKVYDEERVTVALRGETQRGSPVDRGFGHPAAISAVRLAHILSRIDLRTKGKSGDERRSAIPTGSLYQIAEGLSLALGKADSSQEIVVNAIRKEKRFGIFDRDYLTSLVAYVRGAQLYLHLTRSDWKIPKKRKERLPQPQVGEHPMKFRVVPSPGMAIVDSQSVAVDWRGEVFARPSRARVTPDGKVVRRTILLESNSKQRAVERDSSPLPPGLSATSLRRLADLEEQRGKGQIGESEYRSRRDEILRSEPNAP